MRSIVAIAGTTEISPAFLSRFVILQAIGAAGIVGLWIAGIADKPLVVFQTGSGTHMTRPLDR